jgi:hypothetical protein
MKHTLSTLVFIALAASVPAHATLYTADFTGVVSQTQGATGRSIGNTISGHFDFDTVANKFLAFIIDGKSVATGYSSILSIVPARTDAIYTAQVSPLTPGATSNSSFTLDLSSLTTWPAGDSVLTLLLDKNQLATNLDTANNPASLFPSTFGYYTANAAGGNVVALTANLTSITASAPEPATVGLVISAMLGLGILVRRRA